MCKITRVVKEVVDLGMGNMGNRPVSVLTGAARARAKTKKTVDRAGGGAGEVLNQHKLKLWIIKKV